MTWTSILTSSPVAIVGTLAAGVAACRAVRVDPHLSAAAVAAAVAGVASAAAMVPLVVGRRQPWTPTGPAQAALLAMVAHLGLIVVLALTTMFATHAGPPFAAWMLAMFWTTLATTAAACIRLVHTPVPLPSTAAGTTAPAG